MCHNNLAYMPQLEKKQESQLEKPEQRNHREVASQLLHLKKKKEKKKKKNTPEMVVPTLRGIIKIEWDGMFKQRVWHTINV